MSVIDDKVEIETDEKLVIEALKAEGEKLAEPKMVKSFVARDPDGELVRFAVWNNGKVTICMVDHVEHKESICRSSECKEGEDAESCYQEAKKLFGERFKLEIKEIIE